MLFEQIIKFKFKGLGHSDCLCISKTDYFYDKIKISKTNLLVNYCYYCIFLYG